MKSVRRGGSIVLGHHDALYNVLVLMKGLWSQVCLQYIKCGIISTIRSSIALRIILATCEENSHASFQKCHGIGAGKQKLSMFISENQLMRVHPISKRRLVI